MTTLTPGRIRHTVSFAAFVRDRWQAEVKDFLEIDYEALD